MVSNISNFDFEFISTNKTRPFPFQDLKARQYQKSLSFKLYSTSQYKHLSTLKHSNDIQYSNDDTILFQIAIFVSYCKDL